MRVRKIFIEVTNYCNFRCDFCPINISVRPLQYLDFDLFMKAVDEIAEKRIADTITLHLLGEPLVYPHIMKAIRYARAKLKRCCRVKEPDRLTEICGE